MGRVAARYLFIAKTGARWGFYDAQAPHRAPVADGFGTRVEAATFGARCGWTVLDAAQRDALPLYAEIRTHGQVTLPRAREHLLGVLGTIAGAEGLRLLTARVGGDLRVAVAYEGSDLLATYPPTVETVVPRGDIL